MPDEILAVTRLRKISVLIASVALFSGCAEVPLTAGFASSGEGPTGGVVSQQAVTVQTRFVLSGMEEVQSELTLDELFVNVGSVVLDPSEGEGVAFASGEPFELEFDVARGEIDLRGPDLELPYGGDFFVSVQLQPGAVEVNADKDQEEESSLVARGHYYAQADVDADEPSPLPWEPKGMQHSRSLTQQVDFVYQSNSVARIQLGQVSLTDSGDYELLLEVRVASWLEQDVLPRVLDERERRENTGDDVPISLDGTDEMRSADSVLDEGGEGLEGLVGDMGVGARQF